MINWLKTLEVHDFTGVRAAEQWKTQEMARADKRKATDEVVDTVIKKVLV